MYPIDVSMFAFDTQLLPLANTMDLGPVTGYIRNHSVNNITILGTFAKAFSTDATSKYIIILNATPSSSNNKTF